jgi:hypothetical protein
MRRSHQARESHVIARALLRAAGTFGAYAAVSVLLGYTITWAVFNRADPTPLVVQSKSFHITALLGVLPIEPERYPERISSDGKYRVLPVSTGDVLLVEMIVHTWRGVPTALVLGTTGFVALVLAMLVVRAFRRPGYPINVRFALVSELSGRSGTALVLAFILIAALWSVQARLALSLVDYGVFLRSYENLIWPWNVVWPWFVFNRITAGLTLLGFLIILLGMNAGIICAAAARELRRAGVPLLCPICGYCLHGAASEVCPECGSRKPTEIRVAVGWLRAPVTFPVGIVLILAPSWYPLGRWLILLILVHLGW